jgi:pimeloyl-ACP methyl ester carboxylesterase
MREAKTAGISTYRIVTPRLSTRVLMSGPQDAAPVLFLHGNFSSASWWEETMVQLPHGCRGIAFDQRGYGDADPAAKIDASVGLEDCAGDVLALLDLLSIEKAHVVGNSLGGSIIWRLMGEAAERLASVTLVAPGSPHGFGGTRDVNGTPCWPDHAGSGAGVVNRFLVDGLTRGDRQSTELFSPRQVLRSIVLGEGIAPDQEERLLDGMFCTHIGPLDTPGDTQPSPHWPYFAPGRFGAANALSPKYLLSPARIVSAPHKPRLLWIRGSRDQTVSDEAASDPGRLGSAGVIAGWPGRGVFPPQPMIGQTRSVLKKYAASGGVFSETVVDGAGHVPYITHPVEFNAIFHNFLLNEVTASGTHAFFRQDGTSPTKS